MGLENSIRTIEKDNRSRVPMGFHQLTRSSIRYRGFTLIELLVTLAIVAIVAVIAAPSLQSFVLNNRIRSLAVDGGAVMRDFLSPFSLKCILPIAADHVVRRKLRYDRQHAPHP